MKIKLTKPEQKEIISDYTHKLKNFLTAIKGYGEVMKIYLKKEKKEEMKEILSEIDREVNNLNSYLDEMQDLLLLQSGLFKVNKQVFKLNLLLVDIANEWRKIGENHPLSIGQQVERDIFGDQQKIKSLIIMALKSIVKQIKEGNEIEIICKEEKRKTLIIINFITEKNFSDLGDFLFNSSKKRSMSLKNIFYQQIVSAHKIKFSSKTNKEKTEVHFLFQ